VTGTVKPDAGWKRLVCRSFLGLRAQTILALPAGLPVESAPLLHKTSARSLARRVSPERERGRVISGNLMRRYLPLCLLVALLPVVTGCGESPNRPSVVTETPRNPPKTNARFIQTPWDISLFFNLPGGAVVAGATTAATSGAAAPGDNLTGTFVNSNGFAGTISGVLTGTLESGNFDGTLSTITAAGCTAERRFSGPITTQGLNWSPGTQVNDCGGTSPLTSGIQAAAAAPTAPPPCTYTATATGTSVPTAGGTGAVSVEAGTGCAWFATSSESFVTLSASQGTAAGSVQFTVAANTSTTQRTAVLVVAGSSFTITQAAAPVCTYRLNGRERTFDASGALGGVDMRVAPGCAWQAQSDAPWLTITSGASGSGDGTISYTVAANPGLTQRVGRITATRDELLTVTQLGIVCQFTVTPSTTGTASSGGSGTIQVVPNAAACPWTASVSPAAPWITLTPPSGTGEGSVAFTIATNPDPVARTGVVTVAGHDIAITQAPALCFFTLTPSTTSIPAAGGTATIAVAPTSQLCPWGATLSAATPSWITITSGASGTGNGTIGLSFAANPTAESRTQSVFVGPVKQVSTVTFTQAGSTLGTLTGTVINSVNAQPVAAATVTVTPVGGQTPLTATTNGAGVYTFSNLQQGQYNVLIQKPGFDDSRSPTPVPIVAAQTATFNATLVARPVALVITWNPNPTSVDAANPTCGLPNVSFCWQSNTVITETSGTAAPVATLILHFFDPAGAPAPPVAGTWTPTTIPGRGTFAGIGTAALPTGAGGGVEFEYAGTDGFGRTFSFRSPRLILNPVPIIGLTAREGQPAGPVVMPQGSVQPAPARTIRRQ
jgi:hypothetical protein